MRGLDILIPTCDRPGGLGVTLMGLLGQTFRPLRIVISDQSRRGGGAGSGEVKAVIRVLEQHRLRVDVRSHLPRLGMAEQRQFLLDLAESPYVLFVDDDLILEKWVVATMVKAIGREGCGFVGSAPIGLSYIHDVRADEQDIEFWDGPVQPEKIRPGSAQWERYRLHNAANLYHVQTNLGLVPAHPRLYRVAWVGGCVMYDAEKLRAAGGFTFWRYLPPDHSGEDTLAQVRVMERFGGCGIIPSGVYHQELPTTVENRRVDAPHVAELYE